MKQHEKLNYVEYPSRDLNATKGFFLRSSPGSLKILVRLTAPLQKPI